MKRILGACLILALALFVFGALASAATPAAHKAAAATAPKVVTGEIVDLSCYVTNSAKGAAHKSCAAQCIQNGGPMGLLTSKGLLYVLTMNHDKADAFNSAKAHAGDQVKITGAVMVKNGTKALEVSGVEAM
jgi:hypothetical protein